MITLVPLPTWLSSLIIAAVGHDDALAHREAESHARTRRLGSEKGIENPFQMILGDADAVIDDAHHHVAMLVAILRRIVFGHDANRPALALGRIGGVEQQIEHDLLNLVVVGTDAICRSGASAGSTLTPLKRLL